MSTFALTHPAATTARGIENIVIYRKNSHSLAIKTVCFIASGLISAVVFPIILGLELVFKRVPKLLFSITDGAAVAKNLDKIVTYVLSIIVAPFTGVYSPEFIPEFFLRTPPSALTNQVRPFGVETLYGKKVDGVEYPTSVEDLQKIVTRAHAEKKQISIIGAGMSQGEQTVPRDGHQIVINMKHFNEVKIAADGQTATVGAGASWEQVQIHLDAHGKSAIVKQASDPFSVGGSIGINCHGWAHEKGAISSTVKSLTVITADGELKILKRGDELFGCMFGTLGYFGIIVNAELEILDNEWLEQDCVEVGLDEFVSHYKEHIKGNDIPLFGGRLKLDGSDYNPLSSVCMLSYKKVAEAAPGEVKNSITAEAKNGTRFERIGLKLPSHLSNYSVKKLIAWFWGSEKKKMEQSIKMTRNEALHPPINAFKMLHHSNLHTQWLQEYFVKEENLANFLRYLGPQLKANGVRLINATIRPTPKDEVSVLPYAEQDRFAIVICFAQEKTDEAIARTKNWITDVQRFLLNEGDVYYQAYMPYATQDEFERAYGKERVENMRELKEKYDPQHIFGNTHTAKYYDKKEEKNEPSN